MPAGALLFFFARGNRSGRSIVSLFGKEARKPLIDPYIQQYGRRLYGLCVKLCADGGDAQDLYQDTWLKAYQHWDRYDPTRDFGAWITRICVNTYRDRLRRRRLNPLYDRFATSEEKDRALEQAAEPDDPAYREAVSYTHLDVYKRQRLRGADLRLCVGRVRPRLSAPPLDPSRKR